MLLLHPKNSQSLLNKNFPFYLWWSLSTCTRNQSSQSFTSSKKSICKLSKFNRVLFNLFKVIFAIGIYNSTYVTIASITVSTFTALKFIARTVPKRILCKIESCIHTRIVDPQTYFEILFLSYLS